MSEVPYDTEHLMDHDYDGIREYDNPMPGWWVWLFWGTIAFSIPYFVWYHVGVGPSIQDQYEGELAAFAEQLMATYGDLQPDQETILRFMNDDLAMTGMASLFKSKCAQCHLADGSGSVGPNMTDDSYLNINELTDIPEVITNGVVAKGMPEWGSQLTQTQIVLMSAYIARLRGKELPGKAPQGTRLPPWPEPAETPSAAPADDALP